VYEIFLSLFLSKVLEGVRPENVAHEAMSRRLPETVDLRRMSTLLE